MTRPYRWATWGAVAAWFPWGWNRTIAYNYGDNVYYEGDSVYYGDQEVASAEEYAEQAAGIVENGTAATEEQLDQSEWLSLGVFAVTQDGETSGPPPTIYLQLAISKQGIIGGTIYNSETDQSRDLEGAVDERTQRSAWAVVDTEWPIMETGISALTQDESAALVHFADGQTQQWLMVRLEEPEAEGQP